MQLEMTVSLPRDARYVTVLRNVASSMLQVSSAPREAIDDIELAISEACANVIRHATGTEEYSVSLHVDTSGCLIEVTDLGPGFGHAEAVQAGLQPVPEAEAGRGLYLMRVLVDDLAFSRTDSQMKVQFTKRWPSLDGVETTTS